MDKNRVIDKYDVYDIACIIKDMFEENLNLKQENKRLQSIVDDYDQWVRKLNGQYQKNIGSILTTLIHKNDERV
jgi:regulator of replication initiation timing